MEGRRWSLLALTQVWGAVKDPITVLVWGTVRPDTDVDSDSDCDNELLVFQQIWNFSLTDVSSLGMFFGSRKITGVGWIRCGGAMAGRPFPLVDFLSRVGGSLSPASLRKHVSGESLESSPSSTFLLNRVSQSLSLHSDFKPDNIEENLF